MHPAVLMYPPTHEGNKNIKKRGAGTNDPVQRLPDEQMALYEIDPQEVYYDYAVQWGESHNWGLRDGIESRNANCQCAGQTYLDLYVMDQKPERIGPIRENIDRMALLDMFRQQEINPPTDSPLPMIPSPTLKITPSVPSSWQVARYTTWPNRWH